MFTGNNMVMTAGVLRKTVTIAGTLKLWAVCWIGNLVGSALLALALIDNGGNEAITMGGYWFNLIAVTIGNMIGAILFVAVPYHIGSREKKEISYE